MRALKIVPAVCALLLFAALAPQRAHAAFGLGTCENFESGLGSWTVAPSGGGAAGTGAQTSSSPTRSLYTRGGAVTVTSNALDLRNGVTATLSAWVRRGDNSFSDAPDSNEDLLVQWRTNVTGWTTLETFLGQGSPGEVFTRSYTLPAAALANGFQVRVAQTGGQANEDYWHVDDLCLKASSHWGFEQPTWAGAAGEVTDDTNGLNGTRFGQATTGDSSPAPALGTNPGTCRYGNFDGVDEYVEVPDNDSLDFTTSFTVSAWVRMRTAPSELHTIASKDTNYEFHVDSGRHIYWWWNSSGGATRSITTGSTIALNTWTHIAITYTAGAQAIYIDGTASAAASYNETLATNALPFYIGTDWNLIGRAFDGQIDEVYVIPRALSAAEVGALRTKTHPCATAAAQFTINHDTFGLNCAPETVTVNVIDAAAGTPRTDYNAQVTLDTQSGRGTWALVPGSGSGAFSDGAAGDGVATYDWPLGESQARFSLYYPAGPPAVDIDVHQSNDPSIHDNNAAGALTFSASGFVVTAAALGNPPGLVASFAANQTAGTPFALHVAAYGTIPGDAECGIIESYTGDKSLKFWSQYLNPSAGARAVAITTAPPTAPVTTRNAAASEAAATVPQTVTFTDGQAYVLAKYKDVGQIRVYVKDDTTTDPTDLPNGLRGATASFVAKPYDFVLSGIRDSASGAANPQAANATGAKFIAAGGSFAATVTVRDSEGDPTPSFGRETGTAEYVRLIPTLVAPSAASGGNNPAISPAPPTSGFGAFTNGVATGSGFSWPEVGIIELQGAIGDADYLGAGDVIGPTASERVGRFVPHHFNVALNTPSFDPGCSAGGFTYQGQPFSYATAPVITATAVSLAGTTTLNYTNPSGAWFKITNASLTGKAYQSASGHAIDASGVSGPDPAVANIGAGNATLTFNSGTGLVFGRSVVAPFAAAVQLSINVVDADGVTTATAPTTFGAVDGIPFTLAGDSIRYGRVRIATAVGSERVDLPVRMVAEYYASGSAGFVPHAADTCTAGVTVAFSGYTEGLSAGETCVRDAGAPGASGAGCAAVAAPGLRFTQPPAGGDFGLRLAAPGAGNTGSVLIDGTVPVWLRHDWNSATPGDESPTGQATFGLFGGESRQIYTREVYR
jgi:hypothetical protein